jgi:hypothetical protein
MVGSWIVRSAIGDACLGGSRANLTPPIHAAQRAPNADGDAGDHEFVADSLLEQAGFELAVPLPKNGRPDVRGGVRGVPKVDLSVGSDKLPESGQVTVISAVYAGGQRPSVVSQTRTMAVALPRQMIASAARAAPIQLQ